MRFRRVAVILGALVLILLYIIVHNRFIYRNIETKNVAVSQDNEKQTQKPTIIIAVVACGSRLRETLVMIKSALLFNHTKHLLRFIIFTEKNLFTSFTEKLNDWHNLIPQEFEFEILPLSFPKTNEVEWRSLFKPCAAQRLFLPSVLDSVDSLLYVDTDVLFLSSVSDIWNNFNNFNETQLAALTPEHEDEHSGWYNRFARHPYYGQLGVNSGVMLMNLTRMRNFSWESHVLPIYKEYKLRITWGDQDIINILFYYHPERLHIVPCAYNYRPDHCMYMSVCNVTIDGIKILHGNRGYFHSNKQPLFRAVFEAVEGYTIGTHAFTHFLAPLQDALEEQSVADSACGKMSNDVLRLAKKIFLNQYNYDYIS